MDGRGGTSVSGRLRERYAVYEQPENRTDMQPTRLLVGERRGLTCLVVAQEKCSVTLAREGPDATTEASPNWSCDATAEDIHETNMTTASTLILLMEENAKAGAKEPFALLADVIAWAYHPPEELLRAIELALSMEMSGLAMELAQLGGTLFPQDERVQRMAKILAPPVVRSARAPDGKGLDASRKWLREHAGQYRGQWVAVRQGRLMGVASSLRDLEPIIGDDPVGTLVSKVL